MASPTPVFSGVGVALVTLFDGEGEIDAPATADHAARLVEAGVAAIVVAGTTGEAATLDDDERSDLLIAVRYAVDGRVPVHRRQRRPVVTTGCAALEAGRGRRSRCPPGALPRGRPGSAPVLRAGHGCRGPAGARLPLPQGSRAPGVPVDVLRQLPVAGIKDSAGDAERLILEADELPDRPLHGPPRPHPPGRSHRLLRRHPRPRQRRPRGLPARLGRRRHRPARADQRPPRPVPHRHPRPQAHPLRPPRHQPRDQSRASPLRSLC